MPLVVVVAAAAGVVVSVVGSKMAFAKIGPTTCAMINGTSRRIRSRLPAGADGVRMASCATCSVTHTTAKGGKEDTDGTIQSATK